MSVNYIHLLKGVFEKIGVGLVIFDPHGVPVLSNSAAQEFLGKNNLGFQEVFRSFPLEDLIAENGIVTNYLALFPHEPPATSASPAAEMDIAGMQPILDRITAGVMVTDTESGSIIAKNTSADRLVLQPCPEHAFPDDHPVKRAAAGERLENCSIVCESPDGTRHVKLDCEPARLKSGRSIAVLTLHDVTPLKAAEAELGTAEEDVARLSEDFQSFAYAASHDLQEPLRMVSGYTQLLAKRYTGKLDADADQYLRFADEGASRMGLLVTDLLALSRAGNAATRRLERVNLASSLQYAIMLLQNEIKQSGAVITNDELPTVTADQSRLALVMQHLIANSIKFRSVNPLRIHVSAVEDGDRWICCVSDNGLGFDMVYAERVFGVFKRLTGTNFPGTGIGLAIARKVIEIHRGRMWVESEAGQGSKFYFSLPAE